MNLVIDFFLIGGMVVSAIILLLLFKSAKRELPQKLLMAFFAIVLLFILHSYADVHSIDILYILTFIFNDIIELFVGPLIFVYIKSLFEDNKTILRKNWIHFLPLFLYIIVISIPVLISILQRGFVFSYLEVLNDNSGVIFSLFMVYLIIYLCLSLQLFYKYRNMMTSNFSTLSETDFGWVKHMLIGIIAVASIDLITSIISLVYKFENQLDFITLILVVLLILYLGYYGVKQTKILLPDFLLQDDDESITLPKSTTLSEVENEEFEKSKQRLLKVMQDENAFLDEDLTLNKLAEHIPTTDKKLSLLLNKYMNTTFYDFINKYRIESVKEKMASKEFENLTLLGIAYESGFKSKTSFNRIFKKETGLSPSEYKKSL